MKYSKFVIISTNNLDSRIYSLFGLDELLEGGVNVHYCNVGPITYKEVIKDVDYNVVNTTVCRSWNEFNEFVTSLDKDTTLVCVYANFCAKTHRIYRALSKSNISMMYCVNGVFPTVDKPVGKTTSLFKLPLMKILGNRFYNFLKKTSLYAPLKYELHSCLLAKTDYKVDDKTRIINFSSTDYEKSRSISAERKIQGKYCLFIDQNIVYHPDVVNSGMPQLTPGSYFDKMNCFFSKIEDSLGLKVVIAAHPTSDYTEGQFGNRPIITGKTNELAKYADCIIVHYSTAFYYGLIYNKPIIFLTSNEICEKWTRHHCLIQTLAEMLNCTSINIDRIDVPIFNLRYDRQCYKDFLYNYITTPEGENRSNGAILLDIIKGRI